MSIIRILRHLLALQLGAVAALPGATPTTAMASSPTNGLVIQTVFTPPPACTSQGITSMDISSGELWNNAIVPATGVIESSCYPSQFWSSAVATASLPSFSQIVCPQSWETNQLNSTYVVCCPGGFDLYAPSTTNLQRPATNAFCYSWIWPGVLYDVTSWDSASVKTTIAATAGPNGTVVYATPFDGIAASTTITLAQSTSGNSKSQTSKLTTTTNTAAGTTTTSSLSSGIVPLSTLSS